MNKYAEMSPEEVNELIHSKEFYELLKVPDYLNSRRIMELLGEKGNKPSQYGLDFCEVQSSIVLAGLSEIIISDTGKGKSELARDLSRHYFGGNEEEGSANWADGRPNFDIMDLFERQTVDLSTGKYDSHTARQIDTNRLRRLLCVANELNRAPKLKQSEWFDVAEGTYSFRGQNLDLGIESYCMFLATANLNKLNGDFQGICELDRALLNRAHVTIDLDHEPFTPTIENEIELYRRKSNPKLDRAPLQDISRPILAANKEIHSKACSNPYILAFQFLVDRALRYCEKDPYKHKGPDWPIKCTECSNSAKICAKIKSCSPRTTITIPGLATAFEYMLCLREGEDVIIDPMDAALQAFRFTTYHGNLNENIAHGTYAMRKQIMMDALVEELRPITSVLKENISEISGLREQVTYTNPLKRKKVELPADSALIKLLKDKKISYTTITVPKQISKLADEIKERLAQSGMGTDWVEPVLTAIKG